MKSILTANTIIFWNWSWWQAQLCMESMQNLKVANRTRVYPINTEPRTRTKEHEVRTGIPGKTRTCTYWQSFVRIVQHDVALMLPHWLTGCDVSGWLGVMYLVDWACCIWLTGRDVTALVDWAWCNRTGWLGVMYLVDWAWCNRTGWLGVM